MYELLNIMAALTLEAKLVENVPIFLYLLMKALTLVTKNSYFSVFVLLTKTWMLLKILLVSCQGQTYDGASNMMGKRSLVSTEILAIQPKGYDTLCVFATCVTTHAAKHIVYCEKTHDFFMLCRNTIVVCHSTCWTFYVITHVF